MKKLLGLGIDAFTADITPQGIHNLLKSRYNFDDPDYTYSNLWSGQLQSGNSWDNFVFYFESRMGLTAQATPAEVPSQIRPDQNTLDAITETYRTMLNRTPADVELTQWYNYIIGGQARIADLSNALSGSDEYLKLHPIKKEEPPKTAGIVPAIVAGAVAVGAILLS